MTSLFSLTVCVRSRVLRPPGGGSNICFGNEEEKPGTRKNKMASSIFAEPEDPHAHRRSNPPGDFYFIVFIFLERLSRKWMPSHSCVKKCRLFVCSRLDVSNILSVSVQDACCGNVIVLLQHVGVSLSQKVPRSLCLKTSVKNNDDFKLYGSPDGHFFYTISCQDTYIS